MGHQHALGIARNLWVVQDGVREAWRNFPSSSYHLTKVKQIFSAHNAFVCPVLKMEVEITKSFCGVLGDALVFAIDVLGEVL